MSFTCTLQHTAHYKRHLAYSFQLNLGETCTGVESTAESTRHSQNEGPQIAQIAWIAEQRKKDSAERNETQRPMIQTVEM